MEFSDIEDDANGYFACPSCGAHYRMSAYKKHAERLRQRNAWPDGDPRQKLLSDTPMPRTVKAGVVMSVKECFLWKIRHHKTCALLNLRSGIHQVMVRATQLAETYPEIPSPLSDEEEVKEFLVEPEHRFMLDDILNWLRDTSHIMSNLIREGILTKGEVRNVIDQELPHCRWGGGPLTYMTFAIEFRGLLLAFMLLRALHGELPPIASDLYNWLKEEGWDELGYASSS